MRFFSLGSVIFTPRCVRNLSEVKVVSFVSFICAASLLRGKKITAATAKSVQTNVFIELLRKNFSCFTQIFIFRHFNKVNSKAPVTLTAIRA
jgi:hypothetical protein